MATVLRITGHQEVDSKRYEALKRAFGDDILIITQDVEYGPYPVETVRMLIEELPGPVVAVEAIAPFSILMALVQARDILKTKFIWAQFARENGRAKVVGKDASGRDILEFDSYEELVKIEFQTRPL